MGAPGAKGHTEATMAQKEEWEMEVAGKTVIREEVFAQLALDAMARLAVVPVAAAQGTLVQRAKAFLSRLGPQVVVRKNEDALTVVLELGIAVAYGTYIPEVAHRIRQEVAAEIRQVTGWEIECIDILVENLVLPSEAEEGRGEWPPAL